MLFVFYAYRSLVARLRANLTTILALALLVAGCSLGLTFYLRLHHVLVDTAPPENVIVVSKGAPTEFDSRLARDTVERLAVHGGIRQDAGRPVLARELVSSAMLEPPRVGEAVDPVTIRGIDDMSMVVHRATLIAGVAPAANSLEIVMGRRLAARYPNLPVGSEIHLPGGACRVVGTFAADGTPFEDELWTPRSALQIHLKTKELGSVTLVADAAPHVPELVASINQSKDLEARAQTVAAFQAQDAGLATLGWIVLAVLVVLTIVGTGAIATTMNAAVDMRIPELGALAAIGVRRKVLGNIVLLEALLLGVIGGLLGALAGVAIGAALGSSGMSSTPVDLAPPPMVVGLGIALGLVVGAIGGVISALPVRRLDILEAMR